MSEPVIAKIFIVDDHPLVRAGIVRVIEEEDDLRVVGEAASVHEALVGIEESQPDLLIVDISLDGEQNGIDLLNQLARMGLSIPSLVVSMYEEPVYIERAFRAGACGYLLKRESVKKVAGAIRKILGGKNYISDTAGSMLVDAMRCTHRVGDVRPRDILSNREFEVFKLIGHGFSRKEVAMALHLSPKTIETHIDRMREKLQLKSGSQLIHMAISQANAP